MNTMHSGARIDLDKPMLFGQSTKARIVDLFAKNRGQIIRYFLGGCTSAVIGWGALILLVEWGKINYLISANISTLFLYLYSYIVNKYFVFRNFKKEHVKHGFRFIVLQVCLLAFGNIALYIGVDVVHIHYFVMNVSIVVLATAINFTLMKLSVFT